MMITRKSIIYLLMLSLTALLFSACIKDNLDDCETVIRFDYSYNMLSSNAFGDQVDEVTLFIFDEKGVLLRTVHDKGPHVSTNQYAIRLSDLPRGEYQFVAWAQSNQVADGRASFTFPSMTPGSSTIDELTATLQHINGSFDSNLNNLLAGYTSQFTNQSTHSLVTVPMKKITNNVRIVLVDKADSDFKAEDYSMRIEENSGNAIINSRYEVVKDAPVIYSPYYLDNATIEDEKVAPAERDKAIVGEFALSRLMEGHDIRLLIDNREGVNIIDKSLIALIKLIEENESAAKWSFQEYLDRQDRYSIIFYMDGEQSVWLETVLIINGWVINLLEIDL